MDYRGIFICFVIANLLIGRNEQLKLLCRRGKAAAAGGLDRVSGPCGRKKRVARFNAASHPCGVAVI